MNLRPATIGCIAGTPVDTAFGSAFIQTIGGTPLCFAAADSPEEQNELQLNNPKKLLQDCIEAIKEFEEHGSRQTIIYCNSLSSVLDLTILRKNVSTPIITPFDAYKLFAKQYSRFLCIAANSSGLVGVERELLYGNPQATILGVGNLDLVLRIENKESPEHILFSTGIRHVLRLAKHNNMEAVVLACTHFPYLAEAMRNECKHLDIRDLDILDIDNGLKEQLSGIHKVC